MTDISGGTDGASSPAAEFSFTVVDPAELEDVTFVAPMHMRAWKDCYGKFVPQQYLTHADNRYNAYAFQLGHQELMKEGLTMWLAKSGRQPVGLAIFGPDPKDESRGKSTLFMSIRTGRAAVSVEASTTRFSASSTSR